VGTFSRKRLSSLSSNVSKTTIPASRKPAAAAEARHTMVNAMVCIFGSFPVPLFLLKRMCLNEREMANDAKLEQTVEDQSLLSLALSSARGGEDVPWDCVHLAEARC
jgi:hypothetical protein